MQSIMQSTIEYSIQFNNSYDLKINEPNLK